MPFKVGQISKAAQCNLDNWRLPSTLMLGTRAMADDSTFLPQWPRESSGAHSARRKAANLYNAFKRTLRMLASKPFSDDVKVASVPSNLEVIEKDVDRDGMTLTQFCHSQLSDVLQFGLSHFLVDSPTLPEETVTKAYVAENNVHPYFCRVAPDTIVYWNYVSNSNGMKMLVELHIKTRELDWQDDEWDVVVVWEPGMVTTWKKKVDQQGQGAAQTEYQVDQDRTRSNELGYIPLVTTYALSSKTGEMQAKSPLDDLASLNLRHFQSQSDQDTALHYARVPFLHFAGFDAKEVNDTISAHNAYVSKNPQAKIAWVEPTGSALEQGFKDLEMVEARMDVMGSDLLVQKPGNPTATAKSIDSAEKTSDLQSMVTSLQGSIDLGYVYAADWVNVSITGDDVDIELNKSFGLSLNDRQEIDFLLKARIAGEISRELFYAEIQRRGLFAEFDTQVELALAAAEEAKQSKINNTFGAAQ